MPSEETHETKGPLDGWGTFGFEVEIKAVGNLLEVHCRASINISVFDLSGWLLQFEIV